MKRAFSLVEILVALLFISLTLFSLFQLNQQSSKGSMDAYYETLALSLAREPLEVFRGLGFAWLDDCLNGKVPPLAEFPFDDQVVGEDPASEFTYPTEASQFRRRIDVEPCSDQGLRGYRIVVQVYPSGENFVQKWLSRKKIELRGVIVELPK